MSVDSLVILLQSVAMGSLVGMTEQNCQVWYAAVACGVRPFAPQGPCI
ncbi:hypothetical protein SLEP1_g27663 [Rubroshorea leprosula]|uniref:Uncharacterized protein n=1 Tax=Rubroshorea leprosula TaxID=152421 RepID=A0AAV5JWP8_9ROSI|nr:hypothetical protein SLEP1_g27663 [Rubroshorea leprosula]